MSYQGKGSQESSLRAGTLLLPLPEAAGCCLGTGLVMEQQPIPLVEKLRRPEKGLTELALQ